MRFEDICARMATEYERIAGFRPDDGSDAGIRIKVLAGEIYAALCAVEAAEADSFPQTATGACLDLHAAQRGLTRKPAVCAVGSLTFTRGTGLTYDVSVPAGTVCAASGAAVEFETTEPAVLKAGALSVTVPARSAVGGRAYNAAVNAVDTLVTPPVGIEGVHNAEPFSGGADAENDEALRARLLGCFAVLPNGANCETYRRAALEVPGVRRVNVVPRANGIGTVAVYLYGDGAAVSPETVSAVQTALDAMREIGVDVTVEAAEPVEKRVTAYLKPKDGCAFGDARVLCEKAVRDSIEALEIGEPFVLAAVITAIMQTGAVRNCTIPTSVIDYATAAGEIVVPGGITLLETQ